MKADSDAIMLQRRIIYLKRMMLLGLTVIASNLSSFLSKAEEAKVQDVVDYCQTESFQPRCPKSEVILMTSATYGRMQIGRCITAKEVNEQRSVTRDDAPIIGCSANILPLLDEKCSGNSECDIRIIEIGNDDVRPCLAGLAVYLEASFTCIRAADERRSCTVSVSSDPIHLIIASLSSPQRLCGTKALPWTVEAPLGQKISITALDFRPSLSDQRDRRPCLKIGVIVEKSLQITTPMCRNNEKREEEVYLSKRNSIDIIFDRSQVDENNLEDGKLIFRFRAAGCSSLLPPEDMWLKRNEDLMTIGCYNNRQMWRLNCTRDRWIGAVGNCSKETLGSELGLTSKDEQSSSLSQSEQALAIVAICGFTVAICVAIVCVGAVCLRRFYLESKRKDYKTLGCFVDPAMTILDAQRFPGETHGKDQRPSEAGNGPTYSVWMDDGSCHRNQSSSTRA